MTDKLALDGGPPIPTTPFPPWPALGEEDLDDVVTAIGKVVKGCENR